MVKVRLVYLLAPFFLSSALASYIPQLQYRRDAELVDVRAPEDDNIFLGRSDTDFDLESRDEDPSHDVDDLESREPFLPFLISLFANLGKKKKK